MRPDNRTETRTGDRAATIVLLVLQALGILVFGAFGLFIVFVSDSCGSSSTTCDDGRIAWGVMTPPLVAAGLFVISLIWSIKRMAQSRPAWWVPILMTVLSVGGVVLGFAIAASGVHNGNLV
ncbi:DUF6264 family protein [Nocardioides marmorisolisilvae]|nr:DUF6264 family protein [Nocardioides marmorisolisilvae]